VIGVSLLEVEELNVVFARRGETPFTAVDGVSFSVEPGQTVGLVGESGCGKSVTSLAIMGLLPKRGNRVSGQVRFDGVDLLGLSDAQLRDRRGRDIGMIFQDPMSSLNPVVPIGVQVGEVLQRHQGQNKRESLRSARNLLADVGIPDPDRRLKEYPHQISGGMRQRALIAMALACRPRLLIADEPTTALDVTIQAQILRLLKHLVDETGTALIMITHDLGVVAGMCDTVNVLYSGRIVERADRHPLFAEPRHPYTAGLLSSVPRLDSPRGQRLAPVPGTIADCVPWSDGCAFAPRCERIVDQCVLGTPSLDPSRSATVDDTSAKAREVRCNNPVPISETTVAVR
jgi:peptide/nickel transport system ATP-binding protein